MSSTVKQYRIGKELKISWTILTNGEATSLKDRDLTLELVYPSGRILNMSYTTDSNVISCRFYGKDQNELGLYYMILWENKGKECQTVVDRDAFKLVARTNQET